MKRKCDVRNKQFFLQMLHPSNTFSDVQEVEMAYLEKNMKVV